MDIVVRFELALVLLKVNRLGLAPAVVDVDVAAPEVPETAVLSLTGGSSFLGDVAGEISST